MSECFAQIPIGDSTEFLINTDGTYAFVSLPSVAVNNTGAIIQESSCLLQCYSNGYVNKVSLSELMQLRKNYTYSHGIFTNSTLQSCIVCNENDFILAFFDKADKKSLSIISVGTLTMHSMLGLKGDYFIKTTFDVIRGWFILSYEQSLKVPTIIAHCSRNGYLCIDNQICNDEILWLNDNVFTLYNNQILQPERTETTKTLDDDANDDDYDFSSLIGIDKEESLRDKFSGYLNNGSSIPIGQSHVKDILSLCKRKDDFWRTIKCLLECNVLIYRSPIVSYFKSNPKGVFTPDNKILDSIIKLIFSTKEKVEKNLEFLYPFRELLSIGNLSFLQNNVKGLSKPENIHLYGSLMNFTPRILIDYCLDNISPASYYCIYEILQNEYEEESRNRFNKLFDYVSYSINYNCIEGRLIKDLIYFVFLKDRKYKSQDLIKIKTGGYPEYSKLCSSYNEKKKHKDALSNIQSLVGKRLNVRYARDYQNHYLLMTDSGIRVLLPKVLSTGINQEVSLVNVFIALADKAYETLYATQILPVDYKKITQIPLLNSGDIIDVSFNINNGSPTPHNCYKKIRVSIDYGNKTIDYGTKYKARVVRQTSDKYHYQVELI